MYVIFINGSVASIYILSLMSILVSKFYAKNRFIANNNNLKIMTNIFLCFYQFVSLLFVYNIVLSMPSDLFI